MLHQALLLSPSGAGLEATTAMHGDASQLQRATLCSPSQEKSAKVTLTSTCSPLQCCMLITWALHIDCALWGNRVTTGWRLGTLCPCCTLSTFSLCQGHSNSRSWCWVSTHRAGVQGPVPRGAP